MADIVLFHDYFIIKGGAEVFFNKLYLKLKTHSIRSKIRIFTLLHKKSVLDALEDELSDSVQNIVGNFFNTFFSNIFQKSVGKLLTPILNIILAKKIRKYINKKHIFVNTSFFLPINVSHSVIYYHKFPTWFRAFPSVYLTKMPFAIRWLYTMFMNYYLERVYKTFQEQSIIVISNSTKTAYLFYKYWQKHSLIFLPLIIYADSKYNYTKGLAIQSKKFDKDKISILYAGRLDKGKGLDCIINTLKKYRKKLQFLQFYVVGDGPLSDRLLNLKDKLTIHHNSWLPHSKLLDLMQYVDFTISLGDESFGLLLFEGILLNKKIIASLFTGTYDFAQIYNNFMPFELTHTNNNYNCVRNLYNTIINIKENKISKQMKDNSYIRHFVNFYNINRCLDSCGLLIN